MTTPQPIRALYLHVPLCRRRCGYCDFYSEVLDPPLVTPLIDAMLAELEWARGQCTLDLETVFVGGGTPTVLPPEQLERLLRAAGAPLRRDCQTEFTVEANPATVDALLARLLAAAGVNRISLGAQSFDPAELLTLERIHKTEDVVRTIDVCRTHGIRRISLDLIFGIPRQTLASWERSLRAALALTPEHLSCYALTYEPGTPLQAKLAAGEVERVDHDVEADMYELAIDLLAAAGYEQYEISNFARPGEECRHNLVYWRNEPYLGIGPSAAGYVDGTRYKNVADIRAYCDAVGAGRSPRCEEECLAPEQCARETAMLALRLNRGLDRRAFAERFGSDPAEYFADAVARHGAAGLLEVTGAAIRLTRRGRPLADTVIRDFL